MNALEPWHLLVIAGVVVLLFGARRLPDSARSLGRSMRIFRSEMHEAKHDNKSGPGVEQTPPPVAAAVAPQPTDVR